MKAGALEPGQAAMGSTPQPGVNRGVAVLDFIFRIIAIIATLGSAIAMGTTDESLPFFTQFIRFRAKYNDLPMFTSREIRMKHVLIPRECDKNKAITIVPISLSQQEGIGDHTIRWLFLLLLGAMALCPLRARGVVLYYSMFLQNMVFRGGKFNCKCLSGSFSGTVHLPHHEERRTGQ
ncbi:unnamed protein product [Ilex paraguariensis]|uniref:CASP-like protein n=1 Tax=Ilex paraguariensis TaxID=185542 RepID=A0ABC8UYA0_9AQUA